MEQLKNIFARLTPRQRLSLLLAVIFVVGGLYSFVHWKKERDFKPLYTGLSAEDSAAVLVKLKEAGVEYRLADTGNVVSAPSAKVAELRLELAAAGLPKTGRIGFEIFDKNNLGATEFAEHINYRRALEGELERSLSALSEVEQARVHVTFPKDSVFLESREAAKASVMVKIKPGARLSARNVTAIEHLVASAVEGLAPDAVSVLDMQGNLLSRPPRNPQDEASDAALEYRQKLERDLLLKVNTTLEPLLGKESYRASVSADCDLSSGEQSEETLDPARSVMTNSQKTEEMTNGPLSSGVPGTASNLPRPTSRPGASGITSTKRTENVNYQSSRLVRKMTLPRGNVKRLSVAVLLDQSVRFEGSGANARRVFVPPPPETLKSVHDVVAAVVGFSQERGDQITVESLPFESTRNAPLPNSLAPPAQPKSPATPQEWLNELTKNRNLLIGIGAGVLLLVLLMAAAAFFFMRRGKAKKAALAKAAKASMAPQLAGADNEPYIPGADNATNQIQNQMAAQVAEQDRSDIALLASIKLPKVSSKKSEVLSKQLRENAKKDPTVSAHVLTAWIHEKG
jgi:flagellar M-ring protein FliF